MPKKVSAKSTVWASFLVDALDIALNLVVMLVTGSVVMLAELFQGTADLLSSGLLLIGLRRPKRELFLWTVLSALCMLLFASVLSFYFGLRRFVEPEEIENIVFAYIALVVAISSNGYAFYLSARRILGNQKPAKLWKVFSNSKNIMTKNTFVLDLMGMSAALVGLVALVLYQLVGERRFDGLGAMAIGVVLAFLSIDLILDIRRMQARGADVKP